jgi:tetratricopeptide (TPR) repeat protein
VAEESVNFAFPSFSQEFRRIVPLLRRLLLPGLVLWLISSAASAQQKSKVELESSETIFTVVTAMNACGYDDGLNTSEPIRAELRAQVTGAVRQSKEAADATREMCQFYREHQPADPNRDLSQYISLALNLGGAPDFKPKVKEADLPPDTNYVLGFVPLMARFAAAVNLHAIWLRAQPSYEALINKFNEPLAKMVLDTDVYLKNPISGYLGHQFIIYLEPMASPGQVNARNYGDDYFLVAAPENNQLPMQKVQHTYLHFVLDPLALKRPAAMKRLQPILKVVQSAPMEDSFKNDVSLLVTESLIRAIEDRRIPGKNAEPRRQEEVERDMSDGFVFTRYFYDSLAKFESEPTSLKDAFPDFLYYLDVGKETKRASEIHFGANGRGEVVKGKIREQRDPLSLAQQEMSEGDLQGAEKLATDVLTKNGTDAPQASLLLGQIATLNRDKDKAIQYFEKTLETAKEPRLIAWAHIYLGRIYDVDQERDMAVKHYEAALRAGDDTPQTKAAAEKGLKSPYQRRASAEQEQ